MNKLKCLASLMLALCCFIAPAPVMAETFTLEGWKAKVEEGGSIDLYGRLYLEFLLEENPVSGESFGIHGIEGDSSWYDWRLLDVSHELQPRNCRHVITSSKNSIVLIWTASIGLTRSICTSLKRRLNLINCRSPAWGRSPARSITSPHWVSPCQAWCLDYAPLEERLNSFGERCKGTAAYLSEVKAALMNLPMCNPAR